jgi:hypothetical protein
VTLSPEPLEYLRAHLRTFYLAEHLTAVPYLPFCSHALLHFSRHQNLVGLTELNGHSVMLGREFEIAEALTFIKKKAVKKPVWPTRTCTIARPTTLIQLLRSSKNFDLI